jgi:hypothetical protein
MKTKTKLLLDRQPLFYFEQQPDVMDTLPTTVTITKTTTGFNKNRATGKRIPLTIKKKL